MKTIEQAAKEYADFGAPVYVADTEITHTVEDLNMFAQVDFKAGVEFAQRWYSVKEFPPEDVSEFILFKNKHSAYCFKPDSIEMKIKEWFKTNGITHWRPIEYK